MMQEISLNILDIVQNSVRAGASRIDVELFEDTDSDELFFSVKDNGCGMDEEMVARVMDPFVTTRTTRKVGMGISLLRSAAQATGGDVELTSEVGKGTFIKATFSYGHIDRQPLGDMAGTMMTLISMNEAIDFYYKHTFNRQVFEFNTKEMKEILGEVPLGDPTVAAWLKDFIDEGIANIYGNINGGAE
ncbi:MAG: ATP-binding protein [Oscillospiraceae bacterium]|nr:ATP-binding protein [Oscillospiraceae bacterium]